MSFLQIEFSPQAEQYIQALGRSGDRVREAIARAMERSTLEIAGDVVVASKDKLGTRTGVLSKSIEAWWISRQALVRAVGVKGSSPAIRYAYLLTSESKTITPKKAKVLAIPIGPAMHTGTFVQRAITPRDFAGHWRRSKAGNLIFFGTPGRGQTTAGFTGKLQPLFVGKESVVVKGRDVLDPTIERNIFKVTEDINDELAEELERG